MSVAVWVTWKPRGCRKLGRGAHTPRFVAKTATAQDREEIGHRKVISLPI